MKNRNSTIDLNEVITPENLLHLGEHLAICALNYLRPYRAVEQYYLGLQEDIRNKNNIDYQLSDGYDFAQTAMCFLCDHMGKRLGDTIVGKYGKHVTIKQECYREINRLTAKYSRYKNSTLPISETLLAEDVQPFADEAELKETSYDRAEEIIGRLGLTEKQSKALQYYMEGKSTGEISRLLSVAAGTVWRYRNAIRQKYAELANI